jgi:hypothetical protein
MGEAEEEIKWITAGCHRCAVARTLYKPMTGTQILERIRMLDAPPKIQLRDISFILRQMRQMGLTHCLTPDLPSGRVHFLTEKGQSRHNVAFNQTVQPPASQVDWDRYAIVVRAKIRQAVLQELARPRVDGEYGKTASEVRKSLLRQCPASLGSVRRALLALTNLRLARRVPSDDRGCKRYVLTRMGSRIDRELKR